MLEIEKLLKKIKDNHYYPIVRTIDSAIDPEIIINGKKIILFCSNDYLGLANHERLKQVAIETIKHYGVGTGASRLISGNINVHEKLEKSLAQFLGTESAIVFATGYMTNVGTISALVNGINMFRLFKKKTLIISEELNHASIIDGCALAKTEVKIYKHKDINGLESILKKHENKRKIIVTDAVFSMDGDIAPLPEVVDLAKKYGAMLMVDEAHSIGVLGKTGRGVTEHFGIPPRDIPILMGTLSKAFGSIGGYIAGTKNLIDYLRITARSYIFSTALPPAASAVTLEAIHLISENPHIVRSLKNNTTYLIENLRKNNLNVLETETPIIPILIGDEAKAIHFSEKLFEAGILAPCVRWPVVPKGKARIRCVVMATHTQKHMDRLIEVCTA